MTKAVLTPTLVITLISTLALASHVEPAKGKKATFTLVNGFLPCDQPNTATQAGNMPACAPAVGADLNECAFSATGSGKLTAALTGSADKGDEDLKLAVSATGLNSFCENHGLCVSLSFRATTDDCPEGSCTTTNVEHFLIEGGPPTCCIVSNGTCKIKTTLFTAFPGIFATGKNAGIEILGCGLQSQPPLFQPYNGLSCGVLLK